MTKLDYESKPPVSERSRGPTAGHVFGWVVSCMAGAFAASAGFSFAYFDAPPLWEIGSFGLIGGALACIASLPLLGVVLKAPVWVKMLVGAVAAFGLTGGAIVYLVSQGTA